MRQSFTLVTVAALTIAGCKSATNMPGGNAAPTPITALPRTLSVGEQAIASSTNHFDPGLLARLNETRADSNILISPLSATMALGMALNGAEGTTRAEMQTALGLGSVSRAAVLASSRALITLLRGLDAKVDFRIANSLWYSEAFAPAIAPAFLTEASQYFDATTKGLDFAAPASVTTVNDWVKAGTNGRIPSIVDSFSDDLVMLLINAIYFKGDWREGFDRARTAAGPFTLASGASMQVPMMHRTATARLGGYDGRTVVEMGYGGDAYAMTVILPRDGESVNALVESLGSSGWNASFSPSTSVEVDLTMPRFTLSWESPLNDPLKAMGMQRAFVAGGADFTRLSPTEGERLYISFVKQRTFVDVHEVGTEAAAATAVGISIVSLPQRVVVKVDRPFVFAIRERLSGTILFLGKIMQPPTS